MKTVKSHLNDLKEPERTSALKAMEESQWYHDNQEHPCLADALYVAFYWGSSFRGNAYWEGIHGRLEADTYFDAPQLTSQACKDKAVAFMSTERMATKEDHIKLEEVVKSIKAETINEAPPTEPNFGSEDILEEALRITGGDRMSDYGPPDQDFRRTAIMWEQLLNGRIVDGKLQIKPQDVAACMIALKLSRQAHQGKRDNWVDVAGYARCGALCEELES